MAVPPEPLLRAAVRWLEALPGSHSRVRALFTSASEYSDLTPMQYDIGYAWLKTVGLLDAPGDPASVRDRVFDAAILHSEALWLPDVDSLIQSPDELPVDVLSIADTLDMDLRSAFSRVHGVWGKVDTAERKRIGEAGEIALIELLTEAAADHTIDHVARRSDGFGYDISVSGPGAVLHCEVKSTTRRSRMSFYLSRNEFQTMVSDTDWHLIFVWLDAELRPVAVGTVPNDWIATQIPRDGGPFGRWESCRLEVPYDVPSPGLPDGLGLTTGHAGALLTGESGWSL
jgi:hypothetical protein